MDFVPIKTWDTRRMSNLIASPIKHPEASQSSSHPANIRLSSSMADLGISILSIHMSPHAHLWAWKVSGRFPMSKFYQCVVHGDFWRIPKRFRNSGFREGSGRHVGLCSQ